MTWGLFGQIALLIVVFAFVTQAIRCFHDMHCSKCRKPAA